MPDLSSYDDVTQMVKALERRIDDLARRPVSTGPVCQVNLTTTFGSLAASTDYWATGGWSTVLDTHSIFTAGAVSGTIPSYVTIPITGRYALFLRSGHTPLSNLGACKILKNTPNPPTGTVASNVLAYSIASDSSSENTPGAYFEGVLTAGDTLRWTAWCTAANWAWASVVFGTIQTALTVRYIGPT